MRAPKGFGRTYFTLSAMVAYNANVSLVRRHSAICEHLLLLGGDKEECTPEEEESDLQVVSEPALPGGRRRSRNRLCREHIQRRFPAFFHPFLQTDRYTNSTTSPPGDTASSHLESKIHYKGTL